MNKNIRLNPVSKSPYTSLRIHQKRFRQATALWDTSVSLHVGSCVDNSRILVIASALANTIGVDIDQLKLAAAALEWYSEKAVAIAFYAMASGIYTVLGVMPPDRRQQEGC